MEDYLQGYLRNIPQKRNMSPEDFLYIVKDIQILHRIFQIESRITLRKLLLNPDYIHRL